MIEDNAKREPGTRPDTGPEYSAQPRPPGGAGAPWWLVVVLVLGLVVMAAYIAWMNAATLNNRMNYLSDFLESRNSEAELPAPTLTADSIAAWENSLLNAGTFAPDTEGPEWKGTPSEPTQTITGSEVNRVVPPEPTQSVTEPEANRTIPPAAGRTVPVPAVKATATVVPESGYYIKAGEFSSRRAALERVSELRQGNYWGKVIEPESAGGTYIVSVGEFTSFNKAKEKARTIGFIMDIRTSVVKKD